jgi:hydroxyethylthiazole kinase-like uncharacterized protein yjeF
MIPALEILTVAEMGQADRLAIAAGVASIALMENAGRAVAEYAAAMVQSRARILVLCGPGNNGGDGFVAARYLAQQGHTVRVATLIDPARLSGDAATMAARWRGPTEPLSTGVLAGADLVVDALFGAGLSRPLEGVAADVVTALRPSTVPVLAVDVPSGLDGTSGRAAGPVVSAKRTVTFFRLKPGHVLLPGRELCGETVVADIGIPDQVLNTIAPAAFVNAPDLWRDAFPATRAETHKYQRGHAIVVSGQAHRTGAARLGARGALRIGAGLVTVASAPDALAINAGQLTAIMVEPFEGPRGLAGVLSDARRNAVLIGPGAGVGMATRLLTQVVLQHHAGAVLDADALTSFAARGEDDQKSEAESLFAQIRERPQRAVVLTPHEGEFRRLFGEIAGSKLDRARRAATLSGAVIIYKGPDTVIAAPDGRAAINTNAPPWLATAGSGDVLGGFVTGLLAQGMAVWPAACAAVWLHGACASRFGRGLIAEDLPEMLPAVLTALFEPASNRP